ncbi:MAG TPA: Trk system potassium transporter TrkA [Rhodothermales bacterium]|nr:Trk system potassium transporter TrkA [Rhodothermales bacterium]
MRIIVLGAGEVGFDVAQMLSRESHDVIVVDESAEPLENVRSRLDVLTIQGNGTSAAVLKQAGADSADLLIAVTSIDEVNVISCMLADRMGARVTVARVRSGEFSRRDSVLSAAELGIDLIIHPEDSTAEEIVRLIRRASATDVLNFGDDRLQLVGVRIGETSPVMYRSLEDISVGAPNVQFRVMGIQRGMRTIIPRGSERIHKNDQVFVLVRTNDFSAVATVFGVSDAKVQDVMVLGGTQVGARVAALLSSEKGMRVKLIESDRAVAEELAAELPSVLVIHGEGSDVDLLATEGIMDMDAFIAVKNDEASNLVTCLIAKHLGVSKTVALLSTAAYIPISQRIGIDSAVNKKRSVAAEVLRFLRGKHVLSLATVPGLDVEVLELKAGEGSRITRGPMSETRMPDGILIGAVVRPHDVEVATGGTLVHAGDRVIVFALPALIADVEKLFDGRKK